MKTFALIALCCSFPIIHQSMGEDVQNTTENEAEINKETKISSAKFEINDPIVLTGVDKYDRIKYLEQEHIRKQYEGYRVVVDMITQDADQHYIQCFMLENDDGEQAFVFFDITDIVGKRHKKHNQELRDIIKRLEKSKQS